MASESSAANSASAGKPGLARALLEAAVHCDPDAMRIALGAGASPDAALPIAQASDLDMAFLGSGFGRLPARPTALGVCCVRACSPASGLAMARGAMQCAKILLDAGASPDALDSSRCSPILCSMLHMRQTTMRKYPQRHRLDLIAMLALKGADMDALHPNGRPLSSPALDYGETELLQRMLDHGSDILAPDHKGGSILHRCARSGNPFHLTLALRLGGARGIEAPDAKGRTPLSNALDIPIPSNLECAKILIAHGGQACEADLALIRNWGWSDELGPVIASAEASRLKESLPGPDASTPARLPRL